MEKVCDGVRDCSDNGDEKNCTVRSSYGMWSKGLEVLKYFSNCESYFPNWVIPTGAIWMSAKYLSEITSSEVSNQLRADFGIVSEPPLVGRLREISIFDSALKHTVPLTSNKLISDYFGKQQDQRQAGVGFFYQNNSRVSLFYDSDKKLFVDGYPREIIFKNSDDSTTSVSGICVPSATYGELPEMDARIYKIELADSLNLYLIKADNNIRTTSANLRSCHFKNLKPKLKDFGPVCIPKFKIITSSDYSPIFYKLGYDYVYSIDPIQTHLSGTPIRIQNSIRGFISIDIGQTVSLTHQQQLQTSTVDKPFIFVLEDEKTDSIVFVGRYIKGTTENFPTRYADAYVRCKPFELEKTH